MEIGARCIPGPLCTHRCLRGAGCSPHIVMRPSLGQATGLSSRVSVVTKPSVAAMGGWGLLYSPSSPPFPPCHVWLFMVMGKGHFTACCWMAQWQVLGRAAGLQGACRAAMHLSLSGCSVLSPHQQVLGSGLRKWWPSRVRLPPARLQISYNPGYWQLLKYYYYYYCGARLMRWPGDGTGKRRGQRQQTCCLQGSMVWNPSQHWETEPPLCHWKVIRNLLRSRAQIAKGGLRSLCTLHNTWNELEGMGWSWKADFLP